MRSRRISQDTHLSQIMHCSTTTCTMTPPLQVKLVEKPRAVSARSLSGCCSLPGRKPSFLVSDSHWQLKWQLQQN
ncbi:hypothetical protein ACFX1X_031706 [Malus domestica]